jgi:RNA polymerase sigma factor (sigma-70 family)
VLDLPGAEPMSDQAAFQDLLQRSRRGDQDAAFALVRKSEPRIKRTAGRLLSNTPFRLTLEPNDICQAVLLRFFARLAKGSFDLDGEEDLYKLFHVMTRNQVLDEIRKRRTRRRDSRREVEQTGEQDALDRAVDPSGTPSTIVACHELIGEIRRRLSFDDLVLLEQRASGCGWSELALEHGCKADTLRKKLDRALAQVFRELGIDATVISRPGGR